MPACIAVLGMGGTIAGLAAGDARPGRYRAGVLDAAQLWQRQPLAVRDTQQALQARGISIHLATVCSIDSKDLQWPHWRSLLLALMPLLADAQVRAIMITHGTDTAEETAWFLQTLLGGHGQRPNELQKPILLTCAMRPADDLQADGPQNLCTGLQLAASAATAKAVLVVCAGVYAAHSVHKAYTDRDAPFIDLPQSASTVPPTYAVPSLQTLSVLPETGWPWVEIVTLTACADARAVQGLVQAGVRGLVLAATGHGTIAQALHNALMAATAAGVWVWRASRCALGGGLVEDTAFPAVALPPLKARISMQLALVAQATAADDTA